MNAEEAYKYTTGSISETQRHDIYNLLKFYLSLLFHYDV